MKRRLIFLSSSASFVIALMCCDNSDLPSAPIDSGATPPIEAGPDPVDGSKSDAKTPLTSCVDRPSTIDRPPTGRLPCELVPPGLTL